MEYITQGIQNKTVIHIKQPKDAVDDGLTGLYFINHKERVVAHAMSRNAYGYLRRVSVDCRGLRKDKDAMASFGRFIIHTHYKDWEIYQDLSDFAGKELETLANNLGYAALGRLKKFTNSEKDPNNRMVYKITTPDSELVRFCHAPAGLATNKIVLLAKNTLRLSITSSIGNARSLSMHPQWKQLREKFINSKKFSVSSVVDLDITTCDIRNVQSKIRLLNESHLRKLGEKAKKKA